MPSKRVLVAEDREAHWLVLQDFVCDAGGEPKWVRDGRKAFAALQADDYCAVLLDLEMPPEWGGFDFLERFYAGPESGRPPVLVVSIHAREPDVLARLDALGHPAEAIIDKLNLDELRTRLPPLLGG